MNDDACGTLANRQRTLLALLKTRTLATACHDTYLTAVAESRGLAALRSIDRFWKEYSFQNRCPFTAGLLRQRGLLRYEVNRLIREENLSPFIEQMTRLFLKRLAQHSDPLVATVARFEGALAAGAAGDPAEHRIHWEQHPHYVLNCLIADRAIEPEQSRGHFVTIVCPTIEHRYRVELEDPHTVQTAEKPGPPDHPPCRDRRDQRTHLTVPDEATLRS